jgi:hypothetical protein
MLCIRRVGMLLQEYVRSQSKPSSSCRAIHHFLKVELQEEIQGMATRM